VIRTKELNLKNGSRIVVIGGGPAGAFFSIFASKLAQDLGRKLDITIYEKKIFDNQGALGCNMCAGVISESLVQSLALEDINLPSSVVQSCVDSYYFHTQNGNIKIKSSRIQQRGIATIFRGGGPKGNAGKDIQSFDEFLLHKAVEHGAKVKHIFIDKINLNDDKPVIYAGERLQNDCDLLVGASGVKANSGKIYEKLGIGYKIPSTIRATQSEIELGSDWIANKFGNSIHIFLLRIPGVKFVSVIPKGRFITVSLLGNEPNVEYIKMFLAHPVMKQMLPQGFKIPDKFCHCFPKINIKGAKTPFADRLVLIGDASSVRLYKDGIGSAYITSKAAAHTAILYGIGKQNFEKHYLPVCKNLDADNLFGKLLFSVNDFVSYTALLSKGYFRTIQQEQADLRKTTHHSDILWDMFTGSRFYKEIFLRTLNPRYILNLLFTITSTSLLDMLSIQPKK